MTNQNTQTLRCRVRKSGDGFEGTVFVPGLRPAKLIKRDETTVYANRSGVASAAKALAERFGLTLEVEDTTATTSTKGKKTKSKTPVNVTSEVF